MSFIKKCEICGNKFTAYSARSKYCSDNCKKIARERYLAKWHEEHKNYMQEWHAQNPDYAAKWYREHKHYGRDRSRKKRGTQELKRKCIVCGKEFVTTLPHKLTCSDVCSNQNKLNKARERQTPEKAHAQWVKRRYGSEKAREEYFKEKERKAEIVKREREKKRIEEKEKRKIRGVCVVCGKPFETLNPAQKTCSKECGKKLAYSRKDKRIPKEQLKDKDITLEALFRRDFGVCYLCGKKCDWEDRRGNITGDNYPSIDHVIPISKGGLHSWDNVMLAHFKCNVKKSDSVDNTLLNKVPENAYEFKKNIKERKKQTVQIDKDGNHVAIYESTAEAARETGFNAKQIQNCARGESKTYKGFVWNYI